MDRGRRIDEAVTVGPQPSREEIAQLRDEGFRTIINLRESGEGNYTLDPGSEGVLAGDLGLGYWHIPISSGTPSKKRVDVFRRALEEAYKPVYVHCNTGTCSAVLVLLDRARGDNGEDTEDAERVLREARELGLGEIQAPMCEFVRDYTAG